MRDAVRGGAGLGLAACAFALIAGCTGPDLGGGTLGTQGKAVFASPTPVVFTGTVAVGSVFEISVTAAPSDAPVDLGSATIESANEAVFVIEEAGVATARVRAAGPGTAALRVFTDGKTVDELNLRAAPAAITALVDGALLRASGALDARLPADFAILKDNAVSLFVSSVDRCGGELVDIGASTLTATGAPTLLSPVGPGETTLQASDLGAVALTLDTPDLGPLDYAVTVVAPSQIDEVQVAAAPTDTTTVPVWGRAFADDTELVGDHSFSFAGSARVTLDPASGLVSAATVTFPADGEPPDDRPATVTAEVFGETGSIDLLTATATTARAAPPVRAAAEAAADPAASSAGGCGGPVCDATQAAFLLGLWPMRRRLARLRALLGARA